MNEDKKVCPSCRKAFKNLELHVTCKHTSVVITLRGITCTITETRHAGTPHEVVKVKREPGYSASMTNDDGEDIAFEYQFEYKDGISKWGYTAVEHHFGEDDDKIEFYHMTGINYTHRKDAYPNWVAHIYKTDISQPIIIRSRFRNKTDESP